MCCSEFVCIVSIRSRFWSPFVCFSFPSDGLIYWQQKPDHTPNDNPWLRPYYRPRTADIEITAYALLAYTLEKDIGVGLPVSRWLSQQRNSLGGYSSTQVDPFSPLNPNMYVHILQTYLWTRQLVLKRRFKSFRERFLLFNRWHLRCFRGTQREYSSKPLKHSIVKRILVFKR